MVEDTEIEKLAIMDPEAALESLGDKTVFGIMVDGMSACLIKHMTEIKVSLEANEHGSLKTQLQSLKGATSYTRCYRVGKATELLKNSIEANELDKIPVHYSRFVKESILLKRYLRQYICKRESMAFHLI